MSKRLKEQSHITNDMISIKALNVHVVSQPNEPIMKSKHALLTERKSTLWVENFLAL
jgi:hypothetical protein